MRLLICTQAVDKNDPILGFFHRWIEEFAKHCERVTVVCLRKGDHSLPSHVEVISLGERNEILRALEVCTISWGRRDDYDAVFVHMNPEYIVAAGWLWRLMRKRIALWYVHRSLTVLLRIAYALAAVVLTVSRESFPFAGAKVKHVGHGIDKDAFTPHQTEHEEFRIVTIGRISAKKNTRLMCEAALEFATGKTGVVFDVYGNAVTDEERQYERELTDWIAHHDAANVVRMHGPIRNEKVPAVLRGVDVFLNMGETGGVDKAVLEAMACGIPVVTSGGANAKVIQEVSPFLAISVDHKSAVNALKVLYAMPIQGRQEIGTALRAIVSRGHALPSLIKTIIWNLSENR